MHGIAWVYDSLDVFRCYDATSSVSPMGQYHFSQVTGHLMWNMMVTNGF
jgi:hypothetical protein